MSFIYCGWNLFRYKARKGSPLEKKNSISNRCSVLSPNLPHDQILPMSND